MESDLGFLMMTAASIGVIHTLLGPDHYLPFVALSSARSWTTRWTLLVTALCGVGHVLGSVVIGMVGIAAGVSLSKLQWFEGLRGDAAAWLLTGFGLAYMVWGLRRALRARPHYHPHQHTGGLVHSHAHGHHGDHAHPHVDAGKANSITPWALFVIFVLGPCEPLIPVLMYPAFQQSAAGVVAVVLAFGVATIATMVSVVYFAGAGLRRLPGNALQRYSHALAGAALSVCGLGIIFLGL